MSKIYINGVEVGSSTAVSAPPSVTRVYNYIGKSAWDADPYASYYMDEFRIWNVARSRAEIIAAMTSELSGSETGLQLYYKFNEGSGSVAVNSATATGTSFNGALMNSPTWTDPAFYTCECTVGQYYRNSPIGALSLNGVSQYVSIPSAVWFTSAGYTVEAWIFPVYTTTSMPEYVRLFAFGNGPTNTLVEFGLKNTDEALRVPFVQNWPGSVNNDYSQLSVFPSTQPMRMNEWTHVAYSWSSSVATLYINGVQLTTSTAVSAPAGRSRVNNYIGKSVWDADPYTSMYIDEFRIWNVARSQSAIQGVMSSELSGSESGLQLYYKFN